MSQREQRASPGISHQCSISVAAVRGLQKCSVTSQCQAWYNHDSKEENPEIEAGVAEAEFLFLWGISATAMGTPLFRARDCLQLQVLLSLAWAEVQPLW